MLGLVIFIYARHSIRDRSIVFGGFWLILLFEKFEILDEVEVIYAWFREDGKPFPYCIPCQAPQKGKAWHPSWPGGEKSMLVFVRKDFPLRFCFCRGFIGVVSQPSTFSSLELGYVCFPDGRCLPVQEVDLPLWKHGEHGQDPKDFAFRYI